jgi:hypothetical protein
MSEGGTGSSAVQIAPQTARCMSPAGVVHCGQRLCLTSEWRVRQVPARSALVTTGLCTVYHITMRHQSHTCASAPLRQVAAITARSQASARGGMSAVLAVACKLLEHQLRHALHMLNNDISHTTAAIHTACRRAHTTQSLGQHPGTGQTPVPEPTFVPPGRARHQHRHTIRLPPSWVQAFRMQATVLTTAGPRRHHTFSLVLNGQYGGQNATLCNSWHLEASISSNAMAAACTRGVSGAGGPRSRSRSRTVTRRRHHHAARPVAGARAVQQQRLPGHDTKVSA